MRVLCLVPVLLLGQMVSAQTLESTAITLSGQVISGSPVHYLVLAPEGGSPEEVLYRPVDMDGAFEIAGLAISRYRLKLMPPLEAGAEIPRIEIRGLTGAELLIYDPDRPDERVVAKPGIAQNRELFTGGSALLGTFFVQARTQTFDQRSGGAEVTAHAYRELILEFQRTTPGSERQTRGQIGKPR